ncbi:hypothetical protein TNCT_220011 [Trichonephila clavata]|uniref:Uncharacterized protein n=1 Tax=Trichonephila clavata TaxID=2740835 RepID=A0A8X6F8Q0_TRICU|nr:hypothetical protein TNCT_220011 [Trichonephila clavata]
MATGIGLNWLPYSPYRNTWTFLWSCNKDIVCSDNSQNYCRTENSHSGIHQCSDTSRVMQNFAIRLRHITSSDGRHIEHVITQAQMSVHVE